MKIFFKTAILFVTLSLVFEGCSLMRRNEPKELMCPVPSQGCKHGKWQGLTLDTTPDAGKLTGFYYRIVPVRQINSVNDEWSLSFVNKKTAALNFTDNNRQRLMITRMAAPDRFVTESGMYIPKDGNLGALSVVNDLAIFASSPIPEFSSGEGVTDTAKRENREFKIPLPNEQITGNSNIFEGKIKENRISDVHPVSEFLNSDFSTWESQPALFPGGNAFVFASDRSGGEGGTDLWFSYRTKDGGWSDPINCGDEINSKCDEITPFISTDGKTIYFSSNGHETVGGYDIFSAEIKQELISDIKNKKVSDSKSKVYFDKIKNLRAPLNTVADELFPSCPDDCDSLFYFSSNQSTGESNMLMMRGGFDIYLREKLILHEKFKDKPVVRKAPEIEFAEPVIKPDAPKIDKCPFFHLSGKVFHAITKLPLAKAEVSIKDNNKNVVIKEMKTDANGIFRLDLDKGTEYEVTASSEDLFFDSYSFNVEREDTMCFLHRDLFVPEKLVLRINFPYDNYTTPYKFVLDSNGIEMGRVWETELNLLAENIRMYNEKVQKIILVGHTDDQGGIEYNDKLGKRRADFVVNELIKRGIPKEHLEDRSAGKLEPLPQRPGEDMEIYRKRLRRVSLEKIFKKK
ncbi:MAG: OmpA-like protein [Ignavibacteria bacterium]|nr:OmpA-like protein [Ignavibacteria bacterium]